MGGVGLTGSEVSLLNVNVDVETQSHDTGEPRTHWPTRRKRIERKWWHSRTYGNCIILIQLQAYFMLCRGLLDLKVQLEIKETRETLGILWVL